MTGPSERLSFTALQGKTVNQTLNIWARHRTGCYSFASAGGRKWEGAAGGKTGTGKEFMSWNCPPVRKLRQLWRLSGTFCNTSSSTSHLTILISRCTRHVQQCDTTTPGDGGGRNIDPKLWMSPSKDLWKTHIYANSSMYLSCPKKKGSRWRHASSNLLPAFSHIPSTP